MSWKGLCAWKGLRVLSSTGAIRSTKFGANSYAKYDCGHSRHGLGVFQHATVVVHPDAAQEEAAADLTDLAGGAHVDSQSRAARSGCHRPASCAPPVGVGGCRD